MTKIKKRRKGAREFSAGRKGLFESATGSIARHPIGTCAATGTQGWGENVLAKAKYVVYASG